MKKFIYILICFLLFFGILQKKRVYANGANDIFKAIISKGDVQNFLDYSTLDISSEQFLEIKEFTKKEVSDKDEMAYIARSCMDWITKNITYAQSDNNAYEVFKNKKGICYGYANLFQAMTTSLGIPCVVINGDTSFGAHSWNALFLNDNWYFVDPTNGVWITHDFKNYFPKNSPSLLWEENDAKYYFDEGLGISLENVKTKSFKISDTSRNIEIKTLLAKDKTNDILETITISKYLENIKGNFQNFKKLESFKVTNNLYYDEFHNILINKETKNLIVPPNIKTIYLPQMDVVKNTVYNLEKLETLYILSSNKISAYGIEKCPNLKNVHISSFTTEIEKNAFFDCGNFVIHASKESYASKFAQENNIEVIYTNQQNNSTNCNCISIFFVFGVFAFLIILKKPVF